MIIITINPNYTDWHKLFIIAIYQQNALCFVLPYTKLEIFKDLSFANCLILIFLKSVPPFWMWLIFSYLFIGNVLHFYSFVISRVWCKQIHIICSLWGLAFFHPESFSGDVSIVVCINTSFDYFWVLFYGMEVPQFV